MGQSIRRNVTFELPLSAFKELQEDANSRGSVSIHQRAREIVIDYLANREIVELTEQVASLDVGVAHLGDLVRRVAYSVIVHAAGKDSKDANKWIRENMPTHPQR